MDITLSDTNNGTLVLPVSVHGILWLQTHFESDHWNSLAEGEVEIPSEDCNSLYADAVSAGLNVNLIHSLTALDKF